MAPDVVTSGTIQINTYFWKIEVARSSKLAITKLIVIN